ncbi:hypothetical protein [Streptomyces sp. NBC_01497]|uniref:hypothetical protein n=1 Tax=Streptomyces sp. NBC_01497 TaxID=2903885 RepID=UPI002E30B01E|nr:hypothetical protein [Streptomyces sp. NBC_01497]
MTAAAPVQRASASGAPGAYAFDPAARRVTGATSTADAAVLATGVTYRDTIKAAGTLVYRVDLDATSNTYVSAVAVPKTGTKVAYGDKIEVSLQDRDGHECSSNQSEFGVSTDFPRPLAAYAYRTVGGPVATCAEAGPYYVVVRRDGDPGSSADPWDLELRHLSEPGLTKAGPTAAPENWPSASPTPSPGTPTRVAGGTGFSDAARVGPHGAYTAMVKPGETVFYRVPVDWGQQLFSSVDLASAPEPPPSATGSAGLGLVNGAVAVSLFNPALGFVQSANAPLYDGRQKTTSMDPLPPVAYQNRFSYRAGERDMRFAGWYYVRISLSPKLASVYGAGPYGITLRLDVTGSPAPAPAYAGPPGPFSVQGGNPVTGALGTASGARFAPDARRLVGYAGIGTGTALVAVLAGWRLIARRRGVRNR